jgi:hypothetical protein
MDEDIRDQIARLEERIEALRPAIERCRKISLASKLAIILGAIWILLTFLYMAPFVPGAFFAALASVIGGIVLLGSNKTTWEQLSAALENAETMRADLISGLNLRLVSERKTLH